MVLEVKLVHSVEHRRQDRLVIVLLQSVASVGLLVLLEVSTFTCAPSTGPFSGCTPPTCCFAWTLCGGGGGDTFTRAPLIGLFSGCGTEGC